MRIATRVSFEKDVLRIHDTVLLRNMEKVLDRFEKAEDLNDIPDIKPLKGFPACYGFGWEIIGLVSNMMETS